MKISAYNELQASLVCIQTLNLGIMLIYICIYMSYGECCDLFLWSSIYRCTKLEIWKFMIFSLINKKIAIIE